MSCVPNNTGEGTTLNVAFFDAAVPPDACPGVGGGVWPPGWAGAWGDGLPDGCPVGLAGRRGVFLPACCPVFAGGWAVSCANARTDNAHTIARARIPALNVMFIHYSGLAQGLVKACKSASEPWNLSPSTLPVTQLTESFSVNCQKVHASQAVGNLGWSTS